MSKSTYFPVRASNPETCRISGSFGPNGTGSPALLKGRGFTVTRQGVGHFRLTFTQRFSHLLAENCAVRLAAASQREVSVVFGPYDAENRTIDIYLYEQVPGYIPLSLFEAREVGANHAPLDAASGGGILASDTTPALIRITANRELGIHWEAGNTDQIVWNLAVPPDFNHLAPATVRIRAKKDGVTDTVGMVVESLFSVVGADGGGVTDVLINGAFSDAHSVSLTNQAAYPNQLMIGLSPQAHGTDTVQLAAVWIEYTRTLAFDLSQDSNNRVNFDLVFQNSGLSAT